MAVIYAIAVALWWAFRLWQLLRSPSGGHTYRAAAYPAAGVRARAD
jgi:hypothetical protein